MFRVNGFVDGKEKPSSFADEGFFHFARCISSKLLSLKNRATW